MTHRFKPLCTALLTLALVACGAAAPDAAEAAPPSNKSTPVKTEEAPKVGDKIGETAADRAAARAKKAAEREAERKRLDEELAKRGVKRIGWEDLMPEGEQERLAQMYAAQTALLYSGNIAEGSAGDAAVQIGTFNTVKALNGTKIRIPGYTVPFDFSADAQIKEFLLVPYFGACIHSPPPPPNQTVFVMAEKPIKMKDLAQAVWIEGTIYTQTQESDLADAAYTIKLTAIEEYTY